jgi:hypothetical protein
MRGQAALEFLTTYGWAFLVILIMISGLAYFGILTPTSFIPDRCVTPAGFGCDDVRITKNGTGVDVLVYLRNLRGSSIDVTNVTVYDGAYAGPGNTCDAIDPRQGDTQIGNRETFLINCTGANTISGSYPAVREKILLDLELSYEPTGATLTQAARIEIYDAIQS